jgi:hypothetical protein
MLRAYPYVLCCRTHEKIRGNSHGISECIVSKTEITGYHIGLSRNLIIPDQKSDKKFPCVTGTDF